jgi:hypothetical protein
MKIKFQGGYLEYEPIVTGRMHETFDPIPKPSYFHCNSYNYLSYLWVDKKYRHQGKARVAIEYLLRGTRCGCLVLLYNYGEHNGFVLKSMLRSLGFRSCPNLNSRVSHEFYYMFLSR